MSQLDTLAPSEKHLEDWIVANPNSIKCGTIIGRQTHLPSGIADLITFSDYWVTVVELKKDTVTNKTLAQLLRYIRDVQYVAMDIHTRLFTVSDAPFLHVEHAPPPTLCIRGVMVGSPGTDGDLLVAAEACSINVLEYEYTGDQYSFQQAEFPGYANSHYSHEHQRLIKGELGEAFRWIFIGEAAHR